MGWRCAGDVTSAQINLWAKSSSDSRLSGQERAQADDVAVPHQSVKRQRTPVRISLSHTHGCRRLLIAINGREAEAGGRLALFAVAGRRSCERERLRRLGDVF